MGNTQILIAYLILNKRKIVQVETVKYMRFAAENEGDFKFHSAYKN